MDARGARKLLVALGVLLAMVGQAMAHDVWFVPRDGVFALVYGHGSETEKYDVKKVKEVRAYSPAGESLSVQVLEGDGEVSVELSDPPGFSGCSRSSSTTASG